MTVELAGTSTACPSISILTIGIFVYPVESIHA
jgi:hypothetical protein